MLMSLFVRRASTWSIAMFFLVFVAPCAAVGRAEKQEKKQISVKTPSGSFEASVDPNPKHLGLPIYPGSHFLKGNEQGGLDVNWAVSGKSNGRFVVAKYLSPDPVPKVRDFYKKQLGKDVTKFTEKTEDGSADFEIRHKSDQRYVGLKSTAGGTEIDLVHIEGVEDDSR